MCVMNYLCVNISPGIKQLPQKRQKNNVFGSE